MGEICESLLTASRRACDAGLPRENIAVDPGIGFGKNFSQNLQILRRLKELSTLGFPLLVGTSRKSFIGRAIDREAEERLHGTGATVALAIANGAAIVRVHDVKEMRDVADMAHAVISGAVKGQTELVAHNT
jgi:dihydropteroate synthase